MSQLETSVSNIELYRIWAEDEDLELGWLIQKILVREQTEKMKAGEAFHKAIETSAIGDHDRIEAMGYSFYFRIDCALALPRFREMSVNQDYNGLLVKGRVDGISGRVVSELKTTEQFDPDRYIEGLQWRFYLDMTGSDRFEWHIFQMREIGVKEYEIFNYHHIEQFRYAKLHEHCEKAAATYKNFAERFLEPARAKQLVTV